MLLVPEKTLYVTLSHHAMKRATNRDRFYLPKDGDEICRYLNSQARTGYFAPRPEGFVFNSTNYPPLKAFLMPDPLIGKDSFRATTLIRRGEGREERVFEYGPLVTVIWDYERAPRGFNKSAPEPELVTV